MKTQSYNNFTNQDLELNDKDYINQIKDYKGKNIKSVSEIFYPKIYQDDLDEGGDFNEFISNIKIRYNKVTHIKDACLNLIEKNRKNAV